MSLILTFYCLNAVLYDIKLLDHLSNNYYKSYVYCEFSTEVKRLIKHKKWIMTLFHFLSRHLKSHDAWPLDKHTNIFNYFHYLWHSERIKTFVINTSLKFSRKCTINWNSRVLRVKPADSAICFVFMTIISRSSFIVLFILSAYARTFFNAGKFSFDISGNQRMIIVAPILHSS